MLLAPDPTQPIVQYVKEAIENPLEIYVYALIIIMTQE